MRTEKTTPKPVSQRPILLRALRAAAGVARRVLDWFPLTALGLLLTGAATLSLTIFAYERLDLVFLVLGYGALGVTAAALLVVLASTIVLKVRIKPRHRDEAIHLETHALSPTGFTIPSLFYLPFVVIRWEWLEPTRVRVHIRRRFGRLDEEVSIADRGEIGEVLRRVVIEDAFGLCRLAIRVRERTPIEVRPHAGRLGNLPTLTSLAGGDEYPHPLGVDEGDRVDLRRYVPGDPARFIHWKVFGRTRRLMLRVPERALSRARRTVAYQIASEGDDATAAAARVAIESGALSGDWVFGADGAPGAAERRELAVRYVVRSVAARHAAAAGLASFVTQAEKKGPAMLVVFAPPVAGPWVHELVRVASRHRGPVRVVVGVDGLIEVSPRTMAARLFTRPKGTTGSDRARLNEVLGTLRRTRCEVVVIDRASGRVLGDAHLAGAPSREEGTRSSVSRAEKAA